VTRVKICGLTRLEDVEAAVEAGADAVGFVFEPSSKRFVSSSLALELAAPVPPFVTRVGVFGNFHWEFPSAAVDALQAIGLHEKPCEKRKIIAIRDSRSTASVAEIASKVEAFDAVHLDPFDDQKFGGTGKLFDWDFAAEIVAGLSKPVILAGGLTPENVGEAIRRVRPYAVDVSSGVEASPGIKDRVKIRDFLHACRA
jgi:phosphoribosylanthranilate isomerase